MRFDVECRGGGWWHVMMQVDTTGEKCEGINACKTNTIPLMFHVLSHHSLSTTIQPLSSEPSPWTLLSAYYIEQSINSSAHIANESLNNSCNLLALHTNANLSIPTATNNTSQINYPKTSTIIPSLRQLRLQSRLLRIHG